MSEIKNQASVRLNPDLHRDLILLKLARRMRSLSEVIALCYNAYQAQVEKDGEEQ